MRVEKVGKNVRQYTYRARLRNRGVAAVGGARAVLIRKHGDFQVIDGELNFGPVQPHSSVPSLDTFSFRHHGPDGLPGHGEYLRWQITPVAGNRAPVANAGPDASMAVGQRARMDGSRSSRSRWRSADLSLGVQLEARGQPRGTGGRGHRGPQLHG